MKLVVTFEQLVNGVCVVNGVEATIGQYLKHNGVKGTDRVTIDVPDKKPASKSK